MNETDMNETGINDSSYYEIEYNSGFIPGVGKFVVKPRPQKIEDPAKDEVRILFSQMREIARTHRLPYASLNFFDRRARNDNAMIFYQQALFMKDFTDNFKGDAQLSLYFPYYQMMGYEQLRTYFTWRTQVRGGNIANTSLSYVFLYIYELLGNIGVNNPQDGLDKLMVFWKGFSVHDESISKYILRWLKDYHIYYELPQSWGEFVERNNLSAFYPKIKSADNFDLLCAISVYDIRKSAFYTDETCQMIIDCFSYVLERTKQEFEAVGINLDDTFFRPTKKLTIWKPFSDALFYNWLEQADRQIVLSENEIYTCKDNVWTFNNAITTKKGGQFIGYILKHMEVALRMETKYKYRLTANTNLINNEISRVLTESGLCIEKIIPAFVMEFYKEMTKTIVTVDPKALDRIRHDAIVTQEALIVEEEVTHTEITQNQVPFTAQNIFANQSEVEPAPVLDTLQGLRDALNEKELQAIHVLLNGGDIKTFADENGIMLEVLIDSINEKAMDYIGDNLVDEDFVLYYDYINQAKELVK